MYFAVMMGLVTLLFTLHCFLASTGQTTSEFMKGTWKRTRNPFDKGLRLNWLDLLCGAKTCTCRSKCDIEFSCEPKRPAGGEELGKYVTKIYSPRNKGGEDAPASASYLAGTAARMPIPGRREGSSTSLCRAPKG